MREALSNKGWAVTHAASTNDFLSLATSLGHPVAVRAGDAVMSRLTPVDRDEAHPRSLSAEYGLGRFPLHTDCAHHRVPPRWVLLRLPADKMSDRPTLLADSFDLKLSADERAELQFALWVVNPGRGRFLAQVLEATGLGMDRLRLNTGCMRPAHRRFEETAEWLKDRLELVPRIEFSWQPSAVLMIDNWRVLHGRGGGPAGFAERELQRIVVA